MAQDDRDLQSDDQNIDPDELERQMREEPMMDEMGED